MKKLKNFKTKVFILVFILSLTSLTVFSALIIIQTSTVTTNNAYAVVSDHATNIRKQVDLSMLNVENLISQLSSSEAVIQMDFLGVDRASQKLISEVPMISQIYIMDHKGMQIYKSSFPETLGDRSDREYFQKAIAGESVFSDVIVSRSTSIPIVVHAHPIYRNGRIDGVIGASIDLQLLSSPALLSFATEDNTYGFVVDSYGHVIGHPNAQYIADRLDISYLLPVTSVLSGMSGIGTYTFDSIEKLVAYEPSLMTNWGILYQIPKKEAFKMMYKTNLLLMYNSVVVLAVALLASLLISQLLGKPITRIVNLISSISSTESNYSDFIASDNEFGIIERELLTMAGKIVESQQVLEGRVIERTVELSKAMDALVHVQNELLETNSILNALSLTDGLTGLANRRSLDLYMKNFWNLSKRNEVQGAILMIDVDRFKSFNDLRGHVEGDECLRAIAKVLSDTVYRESDFLARYGGEEFIIVMNKVDMIGAGNKADQLCKVIEALHYPHGGHLDNKWVTISIGVLSIGDWTHITIEEAIIRADRMLYQAKEQGRNRYVIDFEDHRHTVGTNPNMFPV